MSPGNISTPASPTSCSSRKRAACFCSLISAGEQKWGLVAEAQRSACTPSLQAGRAWGASGWAPPQGLPEPWANQAAQRKKLHGPDPLQKAWKWTEEQRHQPPSCCSLIKEDVSKLREPTRREELCRGKQAAGIVYSQEHVFGALEPITKGRLCAGLSGPPSHPAPWPFQRVPHRQLAQPRKGRPDRRRGERRLPHRYGGRPVSSAERVGTGFLASRPQDEWASWGHPWSVSGEGPEPCGPRRDPALVTWPTPMRTICYGQGEGIRPGEAPVKGADLCLLLSPPGETRACYPFHLLPSLHEIWQTGAEKR